MHLSASRLSPQSAFQMGGEINLRKSRLEWLKYFKKITIINLEFKRAIGGQTLSQAFRPSDICASLLDLHLIV